MFTASKTGKAGQRALACVTLAPDGILDAVAVPGAVRQHGRHEAELDNLHNRIQLAKGVQGKAEVKHVLNHD